MSFSNYSTGSVDEANIQEWLNFNTSKPGHTALTKEEIIRAVSRLDEAEDDKLIANEPAVPPNNIACVRMHKPTTIC